MSNGPLHSMIVMGISAFIASAFVRPGLARYKAWKEDPDRVRVARRDWRGRYVPDLGIKRFERGFWLLVALLFALGVGFWVIVYTTVLPR